MRLKEGSLVRVKISDEDRAILFGAVKYDGCETRVTRVKTVNDPRGPMLELEGCVSDAGAPYTFTRENVEVVEE